MDISGFGFWQYLGLAVLAIVIFAAVDIKIKAHAAGIGFWQALGMTFGVVKASPQAQALSADATALWAKVQGEFTTLHQKWNSTFAASKQPMAAVNATFADAWDVALAWVKSGDTNGVVLIDAAGVRSTPQSGTSPAYEFTAQAGGGYKRTV